jgi:pyruvate, orthophosphate dikinase
MSLVFTFDHKHSCSPKDLQDLLGGKGANLAEMVSVLDLPVPHGFTISTDAYREYAHAGWPKSLNHEIDEHVQVLEKKTGRQLGGKDNPLLVSVRSGSKHSMPGMMDTVLNLGLNDKSVMGLANASSNERFAFDAYRRFLSMFGRVVMKVDGTLFDSAFDSVKRHDKTELDNEVSISSLQILCDRYKLIIFEETGKNFPQDPKRQLRLAVEAIFQSWNGARAVAYRNREGLSHDSGTAVNVQAMVFGNLDDNSGTGVGFTRNAATGEATPYGDFLLNAQGEDVVSGIRATDDLDGLRTIFPEVHKELLEIFARLEHHYRDMCDTEFTIEQGKLWMLQTRIGKRTGAAALKMAVDMTRATGRGKNSWKISREEAVMRISADQLDQVLHPRFAQRRHALTCGVAASPGAAVGQVFFTADQVSRVASDGGDAILVREETSPEDVHGLMAARGVLTVRGGLVSHAAVVARGWGKPAVVGAEHVHISGASFSVNGTTVKEGDWISIDGATGEVMLGKIDLIEAEPPPEFDILLGWADKIRKGKMDVRANADTAADARTARHFGAQGIGLCRTEHMFLAEDRLPIVQQMILADSEDEETEALERLRVVQKKDFVQLLQEMSGLPVTIRLLDPPLHEFLPTVSYLESKKATSELTEREEELLAGSRYWSETNPMLGTRGVRLGVLKPGLYAMQVRALLQAVEEVQAQGVDCRIEIMIPLTVCAAEMVVARSWIDSVVQEFASLGVRHKVAVGTMIETPRAVFLAGELAAVSDFFSFGTNDLTQLAFGFSRDDIESRLMPTYLSMGILPNNPFETLDKSAVGEMVRMGVVRGRMEHPQLKIGICGEHGGDPGSIAQFYEAGVNYVSCSPYRVPIARLSAAQAVIATGHQTSPS